MKTPTEDRILLRVAEAADLLGISRSTAYQLAAARAIPTIRIGRAVRVPVRELRSWVRQKAQEEAIDGA